MKSNIRNVFGAALIVGLIASVSWVAPLLAQSQQDTGIFTGVDFMGTLKHFAGGSARAPVATVCGSGAAIATGSGDTAGDVTLGSGVTACILTFGDPFATAPTCMVGTPGATKPSYSNSTIALHLNVAVASTLYSWICISKSGG